MDQKKTSKPYSPEFRERAVRLFREHRVEYRSEVAALRALAEKLGCSPDSLRVWARQAQRRLTNQVRHRLCPGLPWDRNTATSALRRDAACTG